METLTIVDTFGFFFRSYYALPKLTNSQGFPTGLLTGFLNFIAEIEKDYKSKYILFALDSKGDTFRHKIDENYKANRPDAPEDLKRQLPLAIDWIKKMGFATCEYEGYEADDIIASAVKFAKNKDIKIRIITHDKDLYQLIEDQKVTIFSPSKKMDIDAKGCEEKFGVKPKLVRDYLSLVGDSADNIPGVKGIGDKGANKLLSEFGTLEKIYENLENVSNQRNKKLLLKGKQSAFLSKKLTSLFYDLKVCEDLDEFIFPDLPMQKIIHELKSYEFKRVLAKVERLAQSNTVKTIEQKNDNTSLKFEAILLDTKEKLFEVIDGLRSIDLVAFDTETDGLDTKKANIVGFSFAKDDKKAYYVPISHSYLGVGKQVDMSDAKVAIKKIFSCKLIGQNLKFDFQVVKKNFGLNPPIFYADTMILGWLKDSSSKIGLDAMAKRFFNYKMKSFKEVTGKDKNFAHVMIEDACFYAAEDAFMTLKLFFKLKNILEPFLFEEATNIENPFSNILFEMEDVGIKIDDKFLSKLLETTNKKISILTKAIFTISQSEFNINSTQQLSTILFEKLNLPHGKRTKTGYSTDEKVLNNLKDKHEIIPKLLEYRELFKIKSTYLEPLIKLAQNDENSRIFTSFLQTGTSTGRLSSKDPNLQNIPVKTEQGREIRKGFVAKKGYKLVALDYSQIELRLLAHFSKDPDMIKAFNEDKDIHLETAIKIFKDETIAKSKRDIAKSINFGLIYGMGQRKLGQTLGISSSEAKSYIDEYFASFKTIKEFIQKTQNRAKIDGFIETLLKRRRYFNYQTATPMLLATYDRESVNTLFQGSAADLIKLAMLKFSNQNTEKYETKLLLQIHDELIFESKQESAQEFADFAKDIMENIYTLKIPLKTSVCIGDNWGELK